MATVAWVAEFVKMIQNVHGAKIISSLMEMHVELAQKIASSVTIQIVSFAKKVLLYPQILMET